MAAKGRFDDHGANIAKIQKVWCDFEVSFFEIEDRVPRAKRLNDSLIKSKKDYESNHCHYYDNFVVL